MKRFRPFRRKGGGGRGDRGAVLVEFAITAPILITLLFAIIDFGGVYNDWINVRQGGRDGIRQAVVDTQPAGVSNCAPSPTPTTTDMRNVVCYTKARVGLDNSKTRVKVVYCDGTVATGCPSGMTPSTGWKSGLPVKICIMYQASSITGLFSNLLNNKVLDTQVESLIETVNATSSPTDGVYEETPLTGQSWSAKCPSSL